MARYTTALTHGARGPSFRKDDYLSNLVLELNRQPTGNQQAMNIIEYRYTHKIPCLIYYLVSKSDLSQKNISYLTYNIHHVTYSVGYLTYIRCFTVIFIIIIVYMIGYLARVQ